MSKPAPTRLALAQARAKTARARLSDTIGQLQERARPTSLAQDVAETLKERGSDLALGMVKTAKTRPARTGAVLAIIGLFLARHRVAGLVRGAIGGITPRSSSNSPKGEPKS